MLVLPVLQSLWKAKFWNFKNRDTINHSAIVFSGMCDDLWQKTLDNVLRWSRRRHTSYVKKLFWSFVFWLRLSSNAWGYDCLRVWPQLFLLFFVCLWPGDFLSLFFLLKIFLFPTLLVSCSFREQLGAAHPSCFASAAHTSYLFSKNKGKLEYHITPYNTTPFFKQLQPLARTTL